MTLARLIGVECAHGNEFFITAKIPLVDRGGVTCVGCECDAWPYVAIADAHAVR